MREFVKKHRLTVCMLVLWMLFEIIAQITHWTGIYPFAIRLVLISILGISIFWLPSAKPDSWRSAISILVPLMALSVPILTIVNTPLADKLAMEDGLVEWLSAIFLFIATGVMLTLAYKLKDRKNMKLAMWLAIAFAVAAFVVGMEEISWMQRIFDVETPAALAEANMQGELNFHNLNTTLFERLYYVGGFVLLILLPFMYDFLHKFVENSKKFNKIKIFLPHLWLLVPFSVISGYVLVRSNIVDSTLIGWTYFSIFILTIIILFSYIQKRSKHMSGVEFANVILTLSVMVIAATVFSFIDYGEYRFWFYSEYREFFIALGIAVYSLDVLLRYNQSIKPKKRITSKT